MTDPADKSDDLIAELAKLMANTSPSGSTQQAQPERPPAPRPAAAPTVRIPGQDSGHMQPSEPRAPVPGGIRIPGMDQPAPVNAQPAASKFDFGRPVTAPPIRQEPLSSLSERLAGQNPLPPRVEPSMQTPRVPSPAPVQSPVAESRPPVQPAPPVTRQEPPALAQSPVPTADAAGDFDFDFGFGQKPQASEDPPPGPVADLDPIAGLIEAELDREEAAPVAPAPRPAEPATRPVMTTAARPVNAPAAPLRANPAPRAPENDRFGVSPDEGLNLRPSVLPSAPAPQSPAPPRASEPTDPMSEIESLIGEAVRVELAPNPARVQSPSHVTPVVSLEAEDDLDEEIDRHPSHPVTTQQTAPVVPPLTTQFAPRRANLKEDRTAAPAYASAEDAIMAAAQASGATVGRVEPSIADEGDYRRVKVKPQRTGGVGKQYVGMAVAAVLLVVAGLGLYWVLNMGRASSVGGAAPELTADTTPVKVKPEAPAKVETDATKSPVLAKMDGNTSTGSEQLVSTDQTNGGNVSRDVTPTAADNESGLANRKVRTVTVRPDGTIVSGDDALAGGEALPIDRPNVPSVPSSETTNLLGEDGATAAPQLTTSDISPAAQATSLQANDGQPLVNTSLVAPTPQPFPIRSGAAAARPASNPVTAVVGAQTLDGQVDLLNAGRAPQQVAAAQPARATTASAAAYVQLASMPTEADANAHMRTANAKYGSLFGGNQLAVQRVDLGEKGIRYRVRLPAASLTDARDICAQIKSAGGDCLATNG